ncbi:hypothetical protein [Metapseudomonas furukawaii]|uniref:Uncharacterized protein n=1 Tax=Metapseudomonas furukawaii TaxID=1149133 RepID=A0AAD1FIH4_METFU|nr:hypothetical protein [Pseudomonas furukawaii]ELS26302.1 hypothetical protein ppKF707_5928 [Pseudomonas furukawaii]BAU77412.1 hypothetical protein KF707C_p230 [Pseudomonas furukawaii]
MTEKDNDLYRGVDRTDPPSHPQLKTGWIRPEPPSGYRNLVAFGAYATIEGVRKWVWELDYLDTDTGVFASEDHQFQVEWPWVDDFLPQAADWDSIGIPHLM